MRRRRRREGGGGNQRTSRVPTSPSMHQCANRGMLACRRLPSLPLPHVPSSSQSVRLAAQCALAPAAWPRTCRWRHQCGGRVYGQIAVPRTHQHGHLPASRQAGKQAEKQTGRHVCVRVHVCACVCACEGVGGWGLRPYSSTDRQQFKS
jgi:hypothetical protein